MLLAAREPFLIFSLLLPSLGSCHHTSLHAPIALNNRSDPGARPALESPTPPLWAWLFRRCRALAPSTDFRGRRALGSSGNLAPGA